jgi:hypothetical protein
MGKKQENPHFHVVCECDYNKDALRKHLKKHFPVNLSVSIKDWDGDIKACSYLFHEDNDAIISKGFTDEEIHTFKLKDISIRETLQSKGPKNVCNIIAEQYKSRQHDPRWSEFKIIAYLLFDYYREQGDWMPNKFQMERYIRQVLVISAGNDKEEWESTKWKMYAQMNIEPRDY